MIPLATVTRMAMIIIPVGINNNVGYLNFTYDACMCIPRAHAGPELTVVDYAYHFHHA